MKIKRFTAMLAALTVAFGLSACSENSTRDGGEITTADISKLQTIIETAEATDVVGTETVSDMDDIPEVKLICDREGNVIQVPDSVNTVISASPSVTEILAGLGAADKIIAADIDSAGVAGVDPAKCTIDFSDFSIDALTALNPDVIIVSGTSEAGEGDSYNTLKNSGIKVVYIPEADSLDGIKLDIEFLAEYMGIEGKGRKLTAEIDAAVEKIKEIQLTTSFHTKKRKVYFELAGLPDSASCGKNTVINEIIELVGAENIYASESGRISNSEESVIAANPDVIITNSDVNEVKKRAGWGNITAVKNNAVYHADADMTRHSHGIAEGIFQIAKAIYPEIYSLYESENTAN